MSYNDLTYGDIAIFIGGYIALCIVTGEIIYNKHKNDIIESVEFGYIHYHRNDAYINAASIWFIIYCIIGIIKFIICWNENI